MKIRMDLMYKCIQNSRYTPYLLAKKIGASAILESASFAKGRERYSILMTEEAFKIKQNDDGIFFVIDGKDIPFDPVVLEGEKSLDALGREKAPDILDALLYLVVDDNSMNLQVAKALLKRTLVGVDTANSALECYDKFDENDYNLVLMDYMMPDIDGVEAMQHLKEMDKEKGKSTPIIVLTADASPDKKDMFMAKGFDDYLLKPVEAGLLENVLMKH